MPRTILNPPAIHPPAGYSHVVEATGHQGDLPEPDHRRRLGGRSGTTLATP